MSLKKDVLLSLAFPLNFSSTEMTCLSMLHEMAKCSVSLQAEARDSKEPANTEATGSIAKQESTDKAQATRQLPEAGKDVSEAVPAAPESLPAPNTPAQSAEAAVGSRSPSLSPQPSQQLLTGTPIKQQERGMPKQAAPAAQEPAPAAQHEGPWQQVRSSRDKPGSQQAARLPGAQKAPKQGRHPPDQDSPPLLQPRLQEAGQQHPEAHQHSHERPQPGLDYKVYPHEQVPSPSLSSRAPCTHQSLRRARVKG